MTHGIIIGVDIGKVLIGGEESGMPDTSFFTGNHLATPEVKDAITSLAQLNAEHEVWLLSKCGPNTQQKTLEWLEDRDFYALTGIPAERVLFCRKRPQKAPIAAEHGFKVFIDDREDIIQSMKDVLPFPILFTSWEKTMRELTVLKKRRLLR